MEKRLLKPTDELILGDVLMLRNRFTKNKFALMKVQEILKENGKQVYIYCECIVSNDYYRKGASVGMDLRAHTTNDKESVELTYFIPVGRILYGKT